MKYDVTIKASEQVTFSICLLSEYAFFRLFICKKVSISYQLNRADGCSEINYDEGTCVEKDLLELINFCFDVEGLLSLNVK